MPEIAPLRAVHYDWPSLGQRIAPPYDVISPTEREGYAARDPQNIVRLILPSAVAGGDKYVQAGARYRRWLAEGVLSRDAQPALYVLHQELDHDGRRLVRQGILARLRLRPSTEGIVLPHERTLSGPKADRLQLLRQVKSNLSPIFALYPGSGQAVEELLSTAVQRPPDAEAHGDDGVDNRLWAVTDAALCAQVCATLQARKALIADGHHRYATGLAYEAEVEAGLAAPRPEGGHHFILAYLCAMSDPGLLILPTHRLLSALEGFDPDVLRQRASAFFRVDEFEAPLTKPGALAEARQRLAARGREGPSFLFVAEGRSWFLQLRAELDLSLLGNLPKAASLRALDVTLLHSLVFQRILGLSLESQERQENLRYVTDAGEAVAAVFGGGAQAAFLLNPTQLDQVRAVAEDGEVMPQKSTFFFPKVPSGLLLSPLDPDESAAGPRS